MAKFTLLEIHLDGATFTANAPFSGDGGGSESESDSEAKSGRTLELGSTGSESDESEVESGSGRSVAPLLVGLVVIVVLGVLVKRLLGGAGEEVDDEELA